MRIYWEVARRSFRRWSTYRAASVAGAITNTFFGFLMASILLAVYRHRADVGGFDAVDAVTFTFLGQGFLMLVEAFGGDAGISERVRTGDIVTDLYRPVDVQGYYLAQDLGRAGFVVLARGLPPFIIGGLVFHLRTPTDPLVMATFVVSTFLALLVSFGIRFLVGVSAFWTLDSHGTRVMANVATSFFSGFIIPLVFFPPWLEGVARVLPFASMAQVPLEIFLGKHQGRPMVSVLAVQALWAAALLAAGRIALAAATRKVVVQGG